MRVVKKSYLVMGVFAIFIILFLLLSPVYVNYGYTPEGTIRLYGAHFNDSINSIALTKSLQVSVPPENFNYSGKTVSSYHYFVNLIMAVFSSLLGIDVFITHFQFAPVILLGSLAIATWGLAARLTNSNFVGAMATFMVMLTGNWYYLANLFYPNASGRLAVAWMDEFSSKLINYQYLSSLIVMFVVFLLLSRRQRLTIKTEVLVALIVALLFGFKFYGGLLLLASLFFVGQFRRIFFLALIPTLIVLSFLKGAGDASFPFELQPLWLIKSMMESPDRLNFSTWELARQTYLSTKSYLGIAKLYVIGLVVYLLINFGPRMLFLINKSKSDVESLIKIIALLGLIIPLVITQRGTTWNVVQLSYYTVALTGLLAALALSRLHMGFRVLGFAALFISLLPGVLYTSLEYSQPGYTATFSYDFVQAAKHLSTLPAGPVLVAPQFSANTIVSAISGKPSYLGDKFALDAHGTNITEREIVQKSFFENPVSSVPETIKYIFTPVDKTISHPDLVNVYNNSEISIYSVDP